MAGSLVPNCVITNLCFSYASEPIFNGFCAQFKAGLNWVIGDESSGKTTLLKLITGQLKAQSGSISSIDSQAPLTIFYIGPNEQAFDQITVTDYFANAQKEHPFFDMPFCHQLAIELGLAPHLTKPIYMLSTGSKRKVFITAALACHAQIVLIDEPFSALDLSSVSALIKALQSRAKDPKTVLVLTGYEVAAQFDQPHVVQLT
jgi:ABC-type multidrug transport system ATPase subunit